MKKTGGKTGLAAVAGSLALTVLALVVMIVYSVRPGSDTDTADAAQGTEPAADSAFVTPDPNEVSPTPEVTPAPTLLAETADMGEEYLSRCIFLGDSTTYALTAYGLLPAWQVWTHSTGTITLSNQSIINIVLHDYEGNSWESTIAGAAADLQPDILIITLGVNGVSFMDEEYFTAEYLDLVQSIQAASPNTKIICQSIYPVIDSIAVQGIRNEYINAANEWIYNIAVQTGVRYLNTHDLLTDGTGNLIADYDNGDGIHLNETGLAVVLQSVRTHAYQ